MNHVEAADAVVAVDDQRSFVGARFQILKFTGDRAHGNQRAALDFCLRELVRLTDVDQMKFFAGVDPPLYFQGIYFERGRHWR